MEFKTKQFFYADIPGFRNLLCRSVSYANGRTGEFHVKSIGYDAQALVQLLRGIIDHAEVGMIGLDYDVYIKSDSVLTTEGMEDLLKQADEFIDGVKKNG